MRSVGSSLIAASGCYSGTFAGSEVVRATLGTQVPMPDGSRDGLRRDAGKKFGGERFCRVLRRAKTFACCRKSTEREGACWEVVIASTRQ